MTASSLPSLIQQQQRECVFLVGVWIPEYRGTGSGANRVSLGEAAGEYGSRQHAVTGTLVKDCLNESVIERKQSAPS